MELLVTDLQQRKTKGKERNLQVSVTLGFESGTTSTSKFQLERVLERKGVALLAEQAALASHPVQELRL